jgi:hypothetical protein
MPELSIRWYDNGYQGAESLQNTPALLVLYKTI